MSKVDFWWRLKLLWACSTEALRVELTWWNLHVDLAVSIFGISVRNQFSMLCLILSPWCFQWLCKVIDVTTSVNTIFVVQPNFMSKLAFFHMPRKISKSQVQMRDVPYSIFRKEQNRSYFDALSHVLQSHVSSKRLCLLQAANNPLKLEYTQTPISH